MTAVRFISADGDRIQEVAGQGGDRLLDIAQNAGQPLEGTCEGQMACSTCHVIVEAEDFAKLPRASEEEEDMLDLASHVTRHSRLACQIWIDPAWDSLTVRIPGAARNMQGR
ncbi:2Fe-2S iron-sulfur cluster-binding protein [Allosphingosinicella indica]|uniref:Ferredoxin n=1 Tax=Allosphingosinicella indica TaxID=941907 RepID=A0A1X7FXJ2_9SPHN|nr:2Fe-2S iron-sulfur cluster-binding protein [Allosphingosinicella indica]SMF60560.1 Ferredoxin [Allosphingosinicella indica]